MSNTVLSTLRDQAAPASHLARISALTDVAERGSALSAMCLVGSYAKGTGGRISDLDIVAFARKGQGPAALDAAHSVLGGPEVLNQFTGTHLAGGSFWKLVYLDFTSVEFHVFEPDAPFRLKRPFLPIWDPADLLRGYVVEGEPIRHEDFPAYEYGDEGLIWELVDCIKWLSRGKSGLAKQHLAKLGTAINSAER